ncbi:nuclear transport factor 2 family protein [Roseovarius salis]|uniref:nuclear transport factor 2 family protein n=1 Tax=Roseovarius salis TaxID=3376063 RepID=UPI0037C79AA0
MTKHTNDDVAAIRAAIARQFDSISWSAERSPDWETFADDFLPDATLFPAARPIAPKSVEAFIDRMKGIAAGELESLEETVLNTRIQVFGNVAVAMAVCGMSENGSEPKRGVEAILLVKDQGHWHIAAQAWDMETAEKMVPADLLEGD